MAYTPPSVEIDYAQAESGPKMQACTGRERRFVWNYVLLGGRRGVAKEAAKLAGYSDHEGTSKVTAHHLLQRERVLEALDEVGRKSFRSLLVPAVAAIGRLIEREDHPDHLKAVLGTLGRLGLVERSGVDVTVSGQVTVNHTDEALQQLLALKQLHVPREKLVELFGFSGLERYEGLLAERGKNVTGGAKLIEGRVEDVSRGTGDQEK